MLLLENIRHFRFKKGDELCFRTYTDVFQKNADNGKHKQNCAYNFLFAEKFISDAPGEKTIFRRRSYECTKSASVKN